MDGVGGELLGLGLGLVVARVRGWSSRMLKYFLSKGARAEVGEFDNKCLGMLMYVCVKANTNMRDEWVSE